MKDWKLIASIVLTIVAASAPSLGPLLDINAELQSTIVGICMLIIRQLGVATPSKNEKAMTAELTPEQEARLKELK